MINLNTQLCEELGLTYWQSNNSEEQQECYTISHEEKELLRKVLLAKAVKLNDSMLEIQADGVAIVNLTAHKLVFENANLSDTESTINLAKVSDMLNDSQHKKHTWFKLKELDLL